MYTCFTGQLEPQAFFGEYNISSLPCVVKMICAGIEEDLGPLRKDEQAQMCTKCVCVCLHMVAQIFQVKAVLTISSALRLVSTLW